MIYEWNILKILTQPIRVIEYETYCNLNYASDLALNGIQAPVILFELKLNQPLIPTLWGLNCATQG